MWDFGPALQLLAWIIIVGTLILTGLAFLVGAWLF